MTRSLSSKGAKTPSFLFYNGFAEVHEGSLGDAAGHLGD